MLNGRPVVSEIRIAASPMPARPRSAWRENSSSRRWDQVRDDVDRQDDARAGLALFEVEPAGAIDLAAQHDQVVLALPEPLVEHDGRPDRPPSHLVGGLDEMRDRLGRPDDRVLRRVTDARLRRRVDRDLVGPHGVLHQNAHHADDAGGLARGLLVELLVERLHPRRCSRGDRRRPALGPVDDQVEIRLVARLAARREILPEPALLVLVDQRGPGPGPDVGLRRRALHWRGRVVAGDVALAPSLKLVVELARLVHGLVEVVGQTLHLPALLAETRRGDPVVQPLAAGAGAALQIGDVDLDHSAPPNKSPAACRRHAFFCLTGASCRL